MEIVTASEMRAIDRETIDVLGIPGPVLMENAGRSVVQHLRRRFGGLETKQIVILCGKGNNGGDGFVASRWLNGMGVPTRTILLGDPDDIKGDAKLNLDILLRLGIPVDSAPDSESFQRFADLLFSCDIIVDAMLGTGLKRAASGIFSEVIETSYGFHLLKVTKREKGREIAYEEVAAQINNELKQKTMQREYSVFIDELRQKANIMTHPEEIARAQRLLAEEFSPRAAAPAKQ